MTAELVTLEVRSRRQWRAWLAKHHTSSPGIWLGQYKHHTARKSVPYEDAVREALSFGWIKADAKAWKFFQALAPTYRRRFVVWIHMAKLPETRERRIRESVALLSAGKKLGLK